MGLLILTSGYAQISEATAFQDGWARIKTHNGYCYIDKTGKEIIPCQYIYRFGTPAFKDGIVSVQTISYKSILIDKTGKEVRIPEKQEAEPVQSLAEPILKFRNGNYGYVDKNGKVLIPFKYSTAHPFRHGFAYVETSKSRGGFQQTSIHTDPMPTRTSAGEYRTTTTTTSYVPRTTSTKKFCINRKGQKMKYDILSYVAIDVNGQEKSYAGIGNYSDGLWLVSKKKKNWGYVDENSKEITPVIYTKATLFREGLALVELKGKWMIIDKRGNEVAKVNLD